MHEPPSTPQLLETGQRLSQSMLWQILRNYYSEQTLAAWADNAVPFHITSNPSIARSYAQVALAFYADLAASGRASTEPLPILDLGAGSGAFAFHFLTQIAEICQGSDARPSFVYVMTDFAPATVDAWESHPQLRPFVEMGLLDFACFDPLVDSAMTLRHSGRVLSTTQPAPLIALANYLFDSLPQDLFGIENGQLYEIGVTLRARTQPAPGKRFPRVQDLDVEYVYTPASFPYYDDAEMDEVLQGYTGLDGEMVRFPVGALACCRQLRQLSGDDLLLLSADLGFVDAEALRGQRVRQLFNLHGDVFSMPVNFHAIGAYLCRRRGLILRCPPLPRSLCVVGFVSLAEAQCRSTQAAFTQHIAAFGPDDASTLMYWITTQTQTLPFEVVVALLRFSHHDPLVLKRVIKHFEAVKDRLTTAEIDLLAGEIRQVWANYYFQGDRYSLPFELGVFWMNLHRPALAVEYFVQAERYYGVEAETIYNLAVCYHQLRQSTEALACLDRADVLPLRGPALVQIHYRRRLASLRATILGEAR